ncbi:MAG: UvrD-helicase domain-containing protein [Spirochaetes bacterium]|nr:UvrD-helicase domain-containing protein [Spirochaetota bacterium]
MRKKIKYEDDLNPAQVEAVRYHGSPLLVLAGAGSGKTRVITYKIAFLINEYGYDPRSILAVTFTNKASNEMRERVNALVGHDAGCWISTFHSTAAKLLRIYGGEVGVDAGFTIIDQEDQTALVKRIMRTRGIDPEERKPKKYVSLISRAKDSLLDAEDSERSDFSTDPLFYEIYKQYEKLLETENLFDFGDLLFRLVRGLQRSNTLCEALKRRFRYVLVDEFQDTNHSQYVLVSLLTLPDGNVCVVGDDDQSIYGFRGAKVENVLNFKKDYAGTKIVRLEENYRSFQNILTASSSVIGNNPGRLGKTLYTKKQEGEKLFFYRAATDLGEAYYIVREIERLVRREGYRYRDIAIFYRINAQSRVLESTFTQARIPYTIVGGLRFYEREEVKDILSYIRLLLNPLDEIALGRVIAKPPRGIGSRTKEAIIEATIARGLPYYRVVEKNVFSEPRASRVHEFLDFMKRLTSLLESASPQKLLEEVYRETGYSEWLKKQGKEEKLHNLEELYNAVEEFTRKNPAGTVAEFIEEVSLDQGSAEPRPGDGEGEGRTSAGDRVFLITLHNAKGLEFPVVFMAGMEEGMFPHFLSGDRPEDVQEERRLCYVGMTRAMERLFLTAARSRRLYGRNIEREVSMFIREVPPTLLVSAEESRLESPRFSYYDGETGPVASARFGQGKKAVTGQMKSSRPVKAGLSLSPLDIKVNDRVVHASFGRGTVREVSGETALIAFDDETVMKFMLKYTPIRKEGDDEDRR